MSVAALLGTGRTKHLAYVRQVIMYRLYTELHISFYEIGVILNRHHATVMYGYHKILQEKTRDAKA